MHAAKTCSRKCPASNRRNPTDADAELPKVAARSVCGPVFQSRVGSHLQNRCRHDVPALQRFPCVSLALGPSIGPKGCGMATILSSPSRCRASSGGPWRAAPPPASMHCLDAMAPPVTTPGGSWPCLALARRLSPPGRLGGPRPEDPRRSPPIGHPQGKLAARPTTASSRPYDTPKNPQAVKFPGYLIFRQPWLAGSVLHRGSHNSWSRRTYAAALGHRARTRHAPGSPFPAARGRTARAVVECPAGGQPPRVWILSAPFRLAGLRFASANPQPCPPARPWLAALSVPASLSGAWARLWRGKAPAGLKRGERPAGGRQRLPCGVDGERSQRPGECFRNPPAESFIIQPARARR